MLSYVAFLFFLISLSLSVTAVVLERRSPLNRSMAVVGFLYAVWVFCSIFVFASHHEGVAMTFYEVSFIGVYFVSPAMTWFYLTLSGKSLRFRLWIVGPLVALAAFVYGQSITTGFRYRSFEPGPFGNVGVPAGSVFWSSLLALFLALAHLLAIVVMLRARAREPSRRMRALLSLVAGGLIASIFLVAAALNIERAWHLPPIESLVGGPFVAFSFYLVLRYRYLRASDPSLAKQLGAAIDQPVFFLDEKRRIINMNDTAHRAFAADGPAQIGSDLSILVDDPELVIREWDLARARRPLHQGLPCHMRGQSVTLRLTPHYDRFQDFTGAVVVLERMTHLDVAAERFSISRREREIIAMLRSGYRNKEIADRLFVTLGTVKNHMVHIFQKTGATNRVELSLLFSESEPEKPVGPPQA